jgi:hypothetical protein
MTFEEMLDQALAMLQRRGRVTYQTLQLQGAARSRDVFSARPRRGSATASKIPRTPRRYEPGTPVAAPG